MVIIKIFPSTFRCLFYIYLSRRADKHTLFMKPPRNVHQCKIFLYTQVIHYNIANQMDLLCNVEFFFPQSKNLSHWFQFTKTSKRIKKKSHLNAIHFKHSLKCICIIPLWYFGNDKIWGSFILIILSVFTRLSITIYM